MQQLNPQQREAATYLGGPLLVVAGAGSGKTGVITQKIAYLINQANYDPRTIFAVTFTNKAAREMRSRTSKLLGKSGRGLHISTFHRLGLDLLQQEYQAAGLRRGFTIFDARDSANLIKELSKNEDDANVRHLQSLISNYKNARLSAQDALTLAKDENQQLAAHVYQHYNERLRAYNALDFDDLLLLPLNLLEQNQPLRDRWQAKVRYMLVDEYQDTNACQYALMRLLSGDGAAFTAVGDDDQSIYAWRGAQPQNIAHLHEDYPQLKTIKLEQNYRCDQKILSAANALIANNAHIIEKRLWSTLDTGEKIRVICGREELDEAETIVRDLHVAHIRKRAAYKDFAILYRSNFQARLLEEKLRELNIPYTLSGGTSFFAHNEIRDLLSYLRLIQNPEDDAAFLRVVNVPKREIGTTTIAKLGQYAALREQTLSQSAGDHALKEILGVKSSHNLQQFHEWVSELRYAAENTLPSELLTRILNDTNYEDHLFALHKQPNKVEQRTKRISELQSWLLKLEEDPRYQTLDGLIQHITLLDILERQEQEQDAVQLMTLHAAKGLEFPHVYIAGVEEELLPHANSSATPEGIEEERRLLYVGMTRAKTHLVLSYAKKRRRGGTWQASEPSRFLAELPQDEINWQDGTGTPASKPSDQELDTALADILAILKQ
ncbi:UvrD-helicase domain-containing protein [Suttonella sp. R2A3]|uniref:UvrD-helicase domain-containing protein n=1 Tax=Suttonella sp. R2A3 TaxID=2908648 RepID=UPI001F483575|nr:UvrD-helicase domain-containing protein [Suttonella sp. R2A3]UJF25088.1 UvrD-helicase domain-containing protein [Suttonella sp. R2A3]